MSLISHAGIVVGQSMEHGSKMGDVYDAQYPDYTTVITTKKHKVPKQKPGKSEQVVCTPPEFLKALKAKLGQPEFGYDLAASHENTVATSYFTEEDDALIQDWGADLDFGMWAFCNPPYEDIEPWVAKACVEAEKGANIAMLLPASTGSNWWRAYVHNKCYVLLLNGRITFVGHKTPYPKDLVTLLYTPFGAKGYEVWDWKRVPNGR